MGFKGPLYEESAPLGLFRVVAEPKPPLSWLTACFRDVVLAVSKP
jgi:hypothetical protein